jgi:hypothetical protein
MGQVGTFCGHLVYFTTISYVLGSFGIFHGLWTHFSPFWYVVSRKIWQPLMAQEKSSEAGLQRLESYDQCTMKLKIFAAKKDCIIFQMCKL